MSEQNVPEIVKPLPGVGVDVGTSNIVVARMMPDGSFSVRHHRNMLFAIDVTDDATTFLSNGSFLYVKEDDKYYILGDDALKIVNILGGGELVRPMQDGLLNPQLKKARKLLFYVIRAVVGEPLVAKESLRFSIPANPVDADEEMNNEFHEGTLRGFFEAMGYSPEPINEAFANIIYSSPVMKSEGEKDLPLTGYSISFGGGMANSCLAMGGMSLVEFSNTKCGDFIDKQVAKATGVPVGKVMRYKETKCDLEAVNAEDDLQSAITIYYRKMVGRVVLHLAKELAKKQREFPGKMEVVLCGGTSMINGFSKLVGGLMKKAGLPFEIASVKLSDQPFFAVSQGACMTAVSDQKKRGG